MRLLLTLAGLLFGLIVLLVVGIALAPSVVPESAYRPRLEAEMERALGRDVALDGATRFKILPSLAIEATDVTIGNPPGFTDPFFARMDALDAKLRLFPLLQGRVELDAFVVRGATVNFEVAADGRPNYAFTSEVETTPGETPGRTPARTGQNVKGDVRLGDVRLVDAALRYRDQMTGADYALTNVGATVTLNSLDEPLTLKGSFEFDEEPVRTTAQISAPRALMEGRAALINAEVQARLVELDLRLTVKAGDVVAYSGRSAISTPSLRELAAWLRSPLPEGDALGPFSIKGDIEGSSRTFSLSDVDLRLDDTRGGGRLDIDARNSRPMIKGALSLTALDLRPYLPAPPEAPARRGDGEPGAAPPSEWSDVPFDVSPLRAADAELRLTTDRVLTPTMTIDRSIIRVTLENGVMNADLQELALYDGGATGALVLDASRDPLRMSLDFDVSALELAPLLQDAATWDWLQGLARAKLSLAGIGRSPRALVQSLSGEGSLEASDGALRGLDLVKTAQAIETLLQERNVGAAAAQLSATEGRTDFSNLALRFDMQQGVARITEMSMFNPLVRANGVGAIGFAEQNVDLVFQAAVAERTSTDADDDFKILPVPITVTGTWAAPKIGVDLEAVARAAAGDALRRQLERRLGDKAGAAAPLLDALFRGGETGAASGLAGDAPAGSPNEEPAAGEAAAGAAIRLFGEALRRRTESEEPPADEETAEETDDPPDL